MRVYVGNLDYRTTDKDLRKTFKSYGVVLSVDVMKNNVTGLARGFGFVEMKSDSAGLAAIAGLDGSELLGRSLAVKQERVL